MGSIANTLEDRNKFHMILISRKTQLKVTQLNLAEISKKLHLGRKIKCREISTGVSGLVVIFIFKDFGTALSVY